MTQRTLNPRRWLVLAALLAFPLWARTEDSIPNPWAELTAVRDSLTAAGPTRAAFVQTYVPAGFSSGEREAGVLSLSLPRCLRWDYSEPYPKSFLVCDDTAHYWNPEDGTGRRYPVDREEEAGLDLVLLGVGELRERYQATGRATGEGQVEIVLTSLRESAELKEATLLVDSRAHRLLSLAYKDGEGNLTRFEISDYQPLPSGDAFSPPRDILWRDDEEAP
jgi:outer membrane lipoprotein-sorting protein